MTFAKYKSEGKGKWRGLSAYQATPLTPDQKLDFESYRNVFRHSFGKTGS